MALRFGFTQTANTSRLFPHMDAMKHESIQTAKVLQSKSTVGNPPRCFFDWLFQMELPLQKHDPTSNVNSDHQHQKQNHSVGHVRFKFVWRKRSAKRQVHQSDYANRGDDDGRRMPKPWLHCPFGQADRKQPKQCRRNQSKRQYLPQSPECK